MIINTNNDKPIFMQIAEQLEDSIFTGIFEEETKIPSTNEISNRRSSKDTRQKTESFL